jgi:hypothetical protein
MRRLPGPADRPLCEGVKTPEAPVELFRGWQRTQTQSSVRALRSLRQQMDVWFCLEQEPKAERHCCVTADPDQTNCAPSGARPGILCFSLDFDLHRCGRSGNNPRFAVFWLPPLADDSRATRTSGCDWRSVSALAIWHKPRSLRRSGHLGFDERNNNLIELIRFLQIH